MHYYRQSQLEENLYKKPKFWILTISISIYVIEFVRNFVGDIMPWQFSLVLLVIELLLQISVYILLCQFFIKASGKLVGKERTE